MLGNGQPNKNASLMRLSAVALAFCLAGPAHAQNLPGLRLMQDIAWHGVTDRVQLHQPSVTGKPPHVEAWERIAIGSSYGNWAYVHNLIDCSEWTQVPFATIDPSGYFVLWGDAPSTVKDAWEMYGANNERVIAGVCGLYGYTKGRPRAPHGEPADDIIVR